VWGDRVTLRNFGLSFSRRGARPNAGVSWYFRRAAGIGLVVLLVLLAVLWAVRAHAGEADDKLLAQRLIAENWPELASACGLGLTYNPSRNGIPRQMGRCAPAVSTVRNFTSS